MASRTTSFLAVSSFALLVAACGGKTTSDAPSPSSDTAGAARSDVGASPVSDPRCGHNDVGARSGRGARFHFARVDAFVVDDAVYSDAYTIVDGSDNTLPRSIPYRCGCECAPPYHGPTHAAALAQSYTLTWDGTFESLYTCEEACNPRDLAGSWGKYTEGTPTLANAGHYRATFSIVNHATDPGWEAGPDGSLSAVSRNSYTTIETPVPRKITVDFDLPDTGFVDVAVPVPPN